MKLTKMLMGGGYMKLANPLCAVALICGTAMGADYHWTGAAGDHLWSTAGNWTDSSGNAVAAPEPATAYTYQFSAWGDGLVVTQDVDVAIGSSFKLVPAASDETEELKIVPVNKSKLSIGEVCSFVIQSKARLSLTADMSGDSSTKNIHKKGAGTLSLNLTGANAKRRTLRIEDGTVELAATSVSPNFLVGYYAETGSSSTPVFVNLRDGVTLQHTFVEGSASPLGMIGRTYLSGKTLNVGGASASSSVAHSPMAVFAGGGTLAYGNERVVYLERGLPLGGTLATARADVRVDRPHTAIRWLFDDAADPLKDVVGAGGRMLAPEGMPEVVQDSERGSVLSIADGKYLKGPDESAGLAELQACATNNPYTVAFWLKPAATCDPAAIIFMWGNGTASRTAGLRIPTDTQSGTTSLMFTIWGDNRKFPTAHAVTDGSWHHFAATYDGHKTFRIYYDGEQVDTFTNAHYGPDNKNLYIGRVYGSNGWTGGKNPYTGLLDDFLLANYELSAADVESLRTGGLAAFLPTTSLDARSSGTITFTPASAKIARLSGNALAGGVEMAAADATLSVGVEAGEAATTFKGKIGGDGLALVKEGADYALELSGPATAVTNVTVKEGTLTLRRPLARRGLVCRYSFDDASQIGLDSSPSGLTLSQDGSGVAAIPDGVSGGAVRFSGARNWLTTDTANRPAAFPRGNGSFSVSFWMRPTAAACAGKMDVFAWGNIETAKCVLFRLQSSTRFIVSHWTSPNLGVDVPDMTDGQWHHVVWTYDGGTRQRVVYFDGVQMGRGTHATDLEVDLAYNMTLGFGKKTGNAYYSGDLDEFMVFDYAWTAAEVADEYARKAPEAVAAESLLPAPVAHWTFDDDANPGADSSANGIALAQVGDVALESGDGICGKAARFSSSSGSFMLEEFPSVLPSSSNAFSVVVRYRADTTQASGYTPCLVMWGDLDTWADGRLVKVGTAKSANSSIYTRVGKALFNPSGYYHTAMATDRTRWLTQTIVYSPQEGGSSHVTRLYVDGELVREATDQVVDVVAQSFAIGANYPSGQNFYGLIDDVQIYDCTLSSGQVRLIAERLEAGKGTAAPASPTVLPQKPAAAVSAGATLNVAADEAVASLSGAGMVHVAPLASLTVNDMRGFSGSLTGYGTVIVEKGATLNKSRVTIANTLTVNVLGTGMTIIIR